MTKYERNVQHDQEVANSYELKFSKAGALFLFFLSQYPVDGLG